MLFQFGNKQYGIPMTYNKCKFNHLDAGIRFAIFDFNGYYIKSQVIFYNSDGTNKTLLRYHLEHHTVKRSSEA